MKKFTFVITLVVMLFGYVSANANDTDDPPNWEQKKEECARNLRDTVLNSYKTFFNCYNDANTEQDCVPCFENFLSSLSSLDKLLETYIQFPEGNSTFSKQECKEFQKLVEMLKISTSTEIRLLKNGEDRTVSFETFQIYWIALPNYWNEHASQ
jgi:hypothetical protein